MRSREVAPPIFLRGHLAFGVDAFSQLNAGSVAVAYGRGMNGDTGVYKGGDSGNIMRGFRGDCGPLQKFSRGRFMGSAATIRESIREGTGLPSTNNPPSTPNSVKDLLASVNQNFRTF